MNKQVLSTFDKEKLLSLNYREKMKYLDELVINYPKLDQIIKKVEECSKSNQISNRPLCMRIHGESGAGKSTIASLYKKRHPDIETTNGTEIPVLHSKIPCPAYIGGLPSKLLYDLGDPFYNKRDNITRTTQRLYYLLKACKVKIIFLDEVQHLVDRNSQKLLRDSSDWFKELIDETKIPIIFLGMPDSSRIFYENEQLANRVRMVEKIHPFKYDGTFRTLLYYYDSLIPLKELSGFAEIDLSKRIFIATEGYIGKLHDLVLYSTAIAFENNTTRITIPMLSKTFEKLLNKDGKMNPFAPEVDAKVVQIQVDKISKINHVS